MYEASKKKDDLADTVMQALSYIDARVAPPVPKKEVLATPRKPTENQNRTKYSRANLAWLYKNGLHNTTRFKKDLGKYYADVSELLKEFRL